MLKKIAAITAGLWLLIGSAVAQTSPNLTYGQVLTPAQWNSLFAGKEDALGFTPLNLSGGVMSGRLVTAPSSATTSGFNLTPGAAGASPASGDLWITSAGFFAQVNGVTIGPIGGATSTSFAGTSPVTVSFPSGVVTYACATCGITGSPLSQFAATTSAQLLGVISDETGTGLVMGNNAPTLIAPVLGVASATSINKVAITAPATSATLTIANGKTLTANNSITLAGTDSTTMTFPTTNATVARTDAGQTFTGSETFSGSVALSSGGSLAGTFSGTPTLSGTNFITLANVAQDTTAWSLLGNATSGTANYSPFTIPGLTSKATPVSADQIMIADSAASGALKVSTLLQVLGSVTSGVSSIDTQTGAFTSGNGIDTSGKVIELTAARRTLPTIQKLTSGTAATYTTPAGVLWIEVKMCGGGAGAVGGGVSPGTGTAGGSTVFGLHTATGGNPGTGGGASPGGTGGSGGTIGAGAIGREQVGGAGIGGLPAIASATPTAGYGGSSLLGFGAQGGIGISGVGASAPANSCGGGGGGGANTSQPTGAGGGGGDGLDLIIGSPVSTYTYTIGSGGTAGAAGTNGAQAGNGGSGFIIVIEHYGT